MLKKTALYHFVIPASSVSVSDTTLVLYHLLIQNEVNQ